MPRAGVPDDPHDVLDMVFARPQEALKAARAMLETGRGPYDHSIARQAIGILRRDFGDLEAAIGELRQAVRLARRAGSPDREADVLATLGVALVQHGRTRAGLATLDQAAALSGGTTRARVLFRRAGARWILGWHREALDDLRSAAPALRRAGDTVWAARALTLRGHAQLALGSVQAADADFRTAQGMFATTRQEHDSVVAVQNRGVAAFVAGDLPTALDLLEEADQGFRKLGTPMLDLVADRCAVLLAAGLSREALEQADGGLRLLDRLRGQATRRAELLLLAARAALLAADPGTAGRRAAEARALFAGQRRDWWAEHARLILVQAELARGPATPRLLADARRLAGRLTRLGSPEVWQAHLLAGRTALALGQAAAAERHLSAASRVRHRGPATSRAGGWLAEALRADAAGQPRRLLHACRSGLALIEEHRLTFGSSELRALVTAQGVELARLALRHLHAAGRTRELLAWTERWRATALAVPPVRLPDDPELQAQLAALRRLDQLLGRARSDGAASAATLERDRARLEARVRATTLRVRGTGAGEARGPGCGQILDALGPGGRLAELVVIDGTLHALLCAGGRVRTYEIGPAAAAVAEMEYARSRLRRLAYDRDPPRDELAALGGRLEEALLGPVARLLGDGPCVVVPPSVLHATPWGLLPSLRRTAFSVAPSAAAWLRARAAAPPSGGVVLVRGPEVPNARAELHAIANLYGHPGEAAPGGPPTGGGVPEGITASAPAGGGLPEGTSPYSGGLAPGGRFPGAAGRPGPGTDGPGQDGPGQDGPGQGGHGGGAPEGTVRVLGGGGATAGAVLEAIDGCALAHVAAHGTFRADSPLFSSLYLDDGPLTVYDLERLRRAPYRLVLSSCDSGQMAPVGADELIGPATALLHLGTAGIVASVVPVNDETAVPVMVRLHAGLRRGLSLAEALRDARGDDVSFIAIGAG
ncbi:CHAT domain-containing protein [Nonomuraea ceibae]|uniref:CHAT domain-containing protein n=1 Tax=Nonomuraea ceibae TaxID=1935170 RepID=UPI001C600175|nr:CHAT domain-containing protein [Nonomuraea ceibae]